MKCWLCKKNFKQDDFVLPVHKYVENYERGDFVVECRKDYIHASHLKETNERRGDNYINWGPEMT